MPDASDPRGRGPLDWGDAFAALPQETPPADAWARLASRLDAPGRARAVAGPARRRARGDGATHFGRRRFARASAWLGVATAAALALVVAWPLGDAPPPASGTLHAAPPPSQAAAVANAPRADATAIAPPRKAADAASIALPKAAEAARKPRLASRDASARRGRTQSAQPAAGVASPPADAATPLDALYAESARLEALLSLARDDRVANAGAALLSAELDAQVAGIDVRLAQPDLEDAQRVALWQARVDVLRQAAGFESTQRVLASQGNGSALLVSVD